MKTTALDRKEKDRLHSKKYRIKNPIKIKEATKRWLDLNREQHNAKSKDWYAANKNKVRDNLLTKAFGITLNDYAEILKGQGGVCAICGDLPIVEGTNKNKNWPVDHSHKTGIVRGILCRSCNVGLGHLKEDPILIKKAIKYLEKFNKEI